MGIYQSGKIVRLNRILGKEKTIIVPLDDSLTVGPIGGLFHIDRVIEEIGKSKATGFLTYKGSFVQNLQYINGKAAILNLSASTIHSISTNKMIINSVEHALAMGFDGVAVHMNISSRYEGEMLSDFGKINRACDRYGMPLMAIIYPRGETGDASYDYSGLKETQPEEYKKLIMHCVRIAVEVGADIVKTKYTGCVNSFQDVVEAAEGVPVLVAGGSLLNEEMILRTAKESAEAGARGICFGRNIFERENPGDMIDKLYNTINLKETIE